MTPNVGSLILIVLGAVAVYIAVKGSQNVFFGALTNPAKSTAPGAAGSATGAAQPATPAHSGAASAGAGALIGSL